MTVAAMTIVAMKVVMLRVVASGDAAPVFEAAEHALDDVALLVDGGIEVELVLAVSLGRDDGPRSPLSEPTAQVVAVIFLVGDQFGRGRHRLDARFATRISWAYSEVSSRTSGLSLQVADSVDLCCGHLASGRYRWPRPRFAPSAVRCAFIRLESMNRRSGASSAPASA